MKTLKAWGLRLLVLAGIALLCWLSGSWRPAVAFALTWGPNYPFLGAVMIGALRLPRALVPVHAIEAKLYRWAGVGLVKRLVTSHGWLLLVGLEQPPRLASRDATLDRAEQLTRGAEMCHLAALVFAAVITLLFVAGGGTAFAAWTLAMNIALNGYPIMLQRSNRWRVQQLRARHPEGDGGAA
jgi:hypothetical protein